MGTIKISQTADWARTFPSLTAVLGAAIAGMGGSAIPIRIANKVSQEIMQRPFAWKWNRQVAAPFLTNQLQQDYSTSITDLGWLENFTRTEINSTSIPLPILRGGEAVRELMPTSVQRIPCQLCWLSNSQAICGTWAPMTKFINPLGLQAAPVQPLLQIRDSNGNLQVLTGFGITGISAPVWSTTANTITPDGSAQWTMADPKGITWRIGPCPPQNGTVYSIQPYYQRAPIKITQASQFWAMDDDMSNTFEQGFLAFAYQAAEDENKFLKEYAVFQTAIAKELGSADREAESFGFYPARSITGQGGSATGNNDPFGLMSEG